MAPTISIDPVTRIEGHARISLFLDDQGAVDDCRLHITQFRGFEAFCRGRPLEEMPALTARTCGICPVSHLLASAKACDELWAVRIPPAAELLRRLLNYGQLIQSHALSFFYLAAPDLLLGMDADPAQRNIFGVLKEEPQVARDGVALRRFGQQLIQRLAGKRIHPLWVVPGGVSSPLSRASRDELLAGLPAMLSAALNNLRRLQKILPRFREEIVHFANFSTSYLTLAGSDGGLEYYDGPLRMVDDRGLPLFTEPQAGRYGDHLAEAAEPDSYLKSPYYRPWGPKKGIYRAGPLARLNAASRCGTPLADEALATFKALAPAGQAVRGSFYYHYARLIEIVHGLEKIGEILQEPQILDSRVRSRAEANAPEGVGICEAPRGTLIHHYHSDRQGRISRVNMIIATGHNNLAMNRGILQAARAFIGPSPAATKGRQPGASAQVRGRGRKYFDQPQIKEGVLNRIEAVIRCYDPCLSCATHALGAMPLTVELRCLKSGDLIEVLTRA